MPGKFYLNAAFLLLHFWRSLPRERHSQRLPFFSSLHRCESKQGVWFRLMGQKKQWKGSISFQIFQQMDLWTMLAFMALMEGWDYTPSHLPAPRFCNIIRTQSMSKETMVYHKRPQTSARTSKLAKLCDGITIFTHFYHVCIALKVFSCTARL